MTASLAVCRGGEHQGLWEAAAYDTGIAVAVMRPGSGGRHFADTVADLLAGAGRIQPTVVPSPRAVTRVDLGRVQVGLAQSARDVAIVHAQRLAPADAALLLLCTARAGVDLYLLADAEPGPALATWAATAAPAVEPAELLQRLAARPGHDTRRAQSPCHAALELGAGIRPTCPRHASAVDCAVDWFPHAIATARATPAAVRARLHELARLDPEGAWPIWAHARDTHLGAQAAARAAGLPASAVRGARLRDLSRDGTRLTRDGTAYDVPAGPASVIATQRDVKDADGLATGSTLFGIRPGSVSRYRQPRAGDPT